MNFSFFADKHPRRKDLLRHETKRELVTKFFLILAVFLVYFMFISMKYGFREGILVSALTWSFFVLCTPIADAGILFDLPLRLITRIRMIFLELFVWALAIGLNIFTFYIHPEVYGKTKLLILFEHILESPFPFWSIILISAIGTFVSVGFGDELLDKAHHRQRRIYQARQGHHRLIFMTALFIGAFILYDFLLKELGIDVPL